MTAVAATLRRPSEFPVLRSIRGASIREMADVEPVLDQAVFLTPVVVDESTAVVRLRGEDLECGALRCEATTPGYRVELLPMCTQQGDELLVGLRIHRHESARSLGCEVRFSAGVTAAHATVMVRSHEG